MDAQQGRRNDDKGYLVNDHGARPAGQEILDRESEGSDQTPLAKHDQLKEPDEVTKVIMPLEVPLNPMNASDLVLYNSPNHGLIPARIRGESSAGNEVMIQYAAKGTQ